MPPETLGQRIRRERESRGWSQTHLAGLVGITYVHLGRLERDSSEPSWYLMGKIAHAMGMGLADFEGLLPPQNLREQE